MPGSEEQEIISLLRENYLTNYCELATCVLIFFEHALTLPDEIQLVWQRELTLSSIIFLANRYIVFMYGVVNVIGAFPWTTNLGSVQCRAVIMLYGLLTILLYAVTPIFSTLRVYAIAGRKWRFALATFLTGVVPVGTNISNVAQASLGYLLYVGPLPICTYDAYYSASEHRRVTVATRACSIVSDVLVIGLTWWRTYALKREADRLRLRASLAALLLRDGTIYFAAILVLNVMHTVFVFYHGNVVYVTIFLLPIPALLTSRFLLNLRRASEAVALDVRLASTSAPDGGGAASAITFSSAPPELRTLQFAPPAASTGSAFMDMDGALWTGADELDEDEDEDEAGAGEEAASDTMWSPSTGSDTTRVAEEARLPDGVDGTTVRAVGRGSEEKHAPEEIELTPV